MNHVSAGYLVFSRHVSKAMIPLKALPLWVFLLANGLALDFNYDFQGLTDGELYGQDGWQSPFPKAVHWKSPLVGSILETDITARAVKASNVTAESTQPGVSTTPIVVGASRQCEFGFSGEETFRVEFLVQRTSLVKDAIGGMIGVGTERLYPATGGLFYGGWAIREEAKTKGAPGGEVHKFLYKQNGQAAVSKREHWYQVRITYNLHALTKEGPTAALEIRDVTAGEIEFTPLYLDPQGKISEASLGLTSDPVTWNRLTLRIGTSDSNSVLEGGKIAQIRVYSVQK